MKICNSDWRIFIMFCIYLEDQFRVRSYRDQCQEFWGRCRFYIFFYLKEFWLILYRFMLFLLKVFREIWYSRILQQYIRLLNFKVYVGWYGGISKYGNVLVESCLSFLDFVFLIMEWGYYFLLYFYRLMEMIKQIIDV